MIRRICRFFDIVAGGEGYLATRSRIVNNYFHLSCIKPALIAFLEP